MAPYSPLEARATDADASCKGTLKIYEVWTIALGSCLGLLLLGSTFFIVSLIKLWRRESARYTTLKQQHDLVISQASYYCSRINKLQALLDRLGTAAHQTQGARAPRSSLESADPADMRMHADDPFAVGEDEFDYESEVPIVNTARAQAITPAPKARKTSVFTDGSTPRTLLLTPGTSYGGSSGGKADLQPDTVKMQDFITSIRESGRPSRHDLTASGKAEAEGKSAKRVLRVANPDVDVGPSPLRNSLDHISESTSEDDGQSRDEGVLDRDDRVDEDEDDTFSTFSGVHTKSPGPVHAKLPDSAHGGAGDGRMVGKARKYQATVEDEPLVEATHRFPLD